MTRTNQVTKTDTYLNQGKDIFHTVERATRRDETRTSPQRYVVTEGRLPCSDSAAGSLTRFSAFPSRHTTKSNSSLGRKRLLSLNGALEHGPGQYRSYSFITPIHAAFTSLISSPISDFRSLAHLAWPKLCFLSSSESCDMHWFPSRRLWEHH